MGKFLSIMIFFFCFYFSAQEYPISKIPENLKKNANAVIRYEKTQIEIKSIDRIVFSENITISILNKSGDEFSGIYIHYNPTTSVSNIKVSIFDADGKQIKTYSKRDFSDFSYANSSTIYSDERVLILKPVAINYPYTISYSYVSESSDTSFISGFYPYNKENISCENSDLKILNSSGIKLRTKITDTSWAKVIASESSNLNSYAFTNIPALPNEPLSPSTDALIPKVEFSLEKFSLKGKKGDFTDWNSWGKFCYDELLVPVSTVTPEITAAVQSLNLSGSTTEKVKTLYQFMQQNTRYLNLDIGIGGWKPIAADEVRKKGYGDCKALTNYMRTLLQAANIKSYYSVINDNESVKKFDKNFPKFSGNHVILMVPAEKDTIWLENTSQKIAFNHLSYTSHNRNVLAVDENGVKIINTPIYKPEDSKELLKARMIIHEDNNVDVNANFEFSGGQYDHNLRYFYYDKKDLTDSLKQQYSTFKIENMAIEDLKNDRDNAKISYTLNFKAPDFSKKLGNDLFFRIMPFYVSSSISNNQERQLPLEIAFPFQNEYEIEYNIPSGYHFAEVPKSSIISSEFGNYKVDFQEKDGKLLVHRVLTIYKGLYPKEKFAEYAAFRKKISGIDNTKVLITKT